MHVSSLGLSHWFVRSSLSLLYFIIIPMIKKSKQFRWPGPVCGTFTKLHRARVTQTSSAVLSSLSLSILFDCVQGSGPSSLCQSFLSQSVPGLRLLHQWAVLVVSVCKKCSEQPAEFSLDPASSSISILILGYDMNVHDKRCLWAHYHKLFNQISISVESPLVINWKTDPKSDSILSLKIAFHQNLVFS